MTAQNPAQKPPSRRRAPAVALLFCVGVGLPPAATVANLAAGHSTPADERLAPSPRWPASLAEAAGLPGALKWYFEERYGLRSSLIELHGRVKVDLLGTTSNHDVLLGKEGWLFQATEGVLDFQRGARRFSPDEVDAWVSTLESERAWLAERGIPYLVVIAPNSHTIYPEFLPDSLAPNAERTRTDQLVEALAARSAVDVLDLRPAVRAARDGGVRLFHRTDTHWNLVGSWYGARAILERLGRTLPVGEAPSLPGRVAAEDAPGGDLARLLGLARTRHEEVLRPAAPVERSTDETGAATVWDTLDVGSRRELVTLGRTEGPSAVLFRDSFGEALIPWLAPRFRRAVWRWTYTFDRELVERERPGVVIRQFVERKLQTVGPDGAERRGS